MVVFVDVDVGVVVGVVVDEVVIPSELSKHSLSLRCQNLRQKLVISQFIRLEYIQYIRLEHSNKRFGNLLSFTALLKRAKQSLLNK